MYRIWAVARHMIAESIRNKIALVGIFVVALMLTAVPMVAEGDGLTLTSRVQSFLAYTLGIIGFVLSVVTVFLSCLAISDEIANKRIFTIATKPIPRWQFFAGKWLGISVLNAALLVCCFGALLFDTWVLKHMKTTVAGDDKALEFEVLTARHGMELKQPDFGPAIEERIRRMREEGRLEDVGPAGEMNIREQIAEDLQKSWRSIGPGQARRFEFKGLMVDRNADGWLHLRFKPTHPGGMSEAVLPAVIQCGDTSDPDTLTSQIMESYPVDRFAKIPIPNWAVNKDGTLFVMVGNADPENTFTFEGNDSFELLYDLGTFHWNLFRALSIVWCRLAFLAAVGLLMSSFLSFPVACMGCFMVFIVSSCAGFLVGAVAWASPGATGAEDPLWVFGPALRSLASGFIWLMPDFSKYDPAGNVVNGRLVPLMWVADSLAMLVFIKGLIVGVLGCIILTKREVAQVTS